MSENEENDSKEDLISISITSSDNFEVLFLQITIFAITRIYLPYKINHNLL